MKIYCSVCSKELIRKPGQSLRWSRSYCSRLCQSVGQRKNSPIKCKACGKEFYCSPSQQRLRNRQTCSKKCKGKLMEAKQMGRLTDRRGVIHKLQMIMNQYVRLRDCGGSKGSVACISCGIVYPYAKLDGGHFIAITCSTLRFDERNINAQCIKCNRYLRGNSRHYLRGMIKKYGQEVVDEIESKEFTTRKWTLPELLEIRDRYRKKVKDLNESA